MKTLYIQPATLYAIYPGSPRAAPPVMMAAGRGGKGKEPQESGNGLERLYLKAAPFIYYGTYY